MVGLCRDCLRLAFCSKDSPTSKARSIKNTLQAHTPSHFTTHKHTHRSSALKPSARLCSKRQSMPPHFVLRLPASGNPMIWQAAEPSETRDRRMPCSLAQVPKHASEWLCWFVICCVGLDQCVGMPILGVQEAEASIGSCLTSLLNLTCSQTHRHHKHDDSTASTPHKQRHSCAWL